MHKRLPPLPASQGPVPCPTHAVWLQLPIARRQQCHERRAPRRIDVSHSALSEACNHAHQEMHPSHLQRAAYGYVRQSTGHQVRSHPESQRRPEARADQARELGCAHVMVSDEDVGRSGPGRHERPGFGLLLAAVCAGRVGAVFALAASRLARNNRDWHHLIDWGALTETWRIDDDGIYDPRQLNDRFGLGMKGAMAANALGLRRQRARHAFAANIQRGHGMWEGPRRIRAHA
jgi:DNA invertase Pin-like site-specific DNA recombinase